MVGEMAYHFVVLGEVGPSILASSAIQMGNRDSDVIVVPVWSLISQ